MARHIPLSKRLHTEKPPNKLTLEAAALWGEESRWLPEMQEITATACYFWLGWKGTSRSSLGLSLLVIPGYRKRLTYCSFRRQVLDLPVWCWQELRRSELLAPVLLLHCEWQRMQLCVLLLVYFERLQGKISKVCKSPKFNEMLTRQATGNTRSKACLSTVFSSW